MTIYEQAQHFSTRLRPGTRAMWSRCRTVWIRTPDLLRRGVRATPGLLLDGTLLALDALRLEGTRSRQQALADLRALPGLLARALRRSLVRLLHAIAHSEAVRWTVLTLERSADAAHRMPLRWKLAACILALIPMAVSFELRTGFLEAHVFSALASRLQWTVGQGPSPSIVYPQSGPFDEERGYSRIPEFVRNLSRGGYRIGEQARFSGTLAMLARAGLTPPWREPPSDGLVIRDASGDTLFRGSSRRDLLASYDELPPLVVSTLLYIENRGLISDPEPTSNPAVDWARFAKASGLWAGRRIGLPLPIEGGSTLAVQLEKLRHFSGGRTRSPADKLRQIAAASLRAYRLGPDTRSARREIILGYLNSAPLSATPSHGEVNGLGEGLRYWFDRDPHGTLLAIAHPGSIEQQARAYRAVLALVCALRAPTHYLIEDRPALEKRMAFYTDQLEETGVLPRELAAAVRETPLALEPDQRTRTPHWFRSDKSTDAVRGEVARLLGVKDRYALDRLDVDVESTVDAALERRIHDLFRRISNPDSVAAAGLTGEHLLPTGDPASVTYSLLLLETTPAGYRVCAHVDNLDQPFDPILGMKMDLGSTAKLRTLAHYLEIVERLHGELAPLGSDSLESLAHSARDPITRWAAAALDSAAAPTLDELLERSLERVYSASPDEPFFTGGGLHVFHNFDPDDNGRRLTIREALVKSTNLVFVRLIRDVVRYHEAHLPYDPEAVLNDPDHPERRRLLSLAEADESRQILYRAWSRWHAVSPDTLIPRLLGPGRTPFRAAVLHDAWSADTSVASAASWIRRWVPEVTPGEALLAVTQVSRRRFSLLDQAYVCRMHPLELWAAGELVRHPDLPWQALWAASDAARAEAMAWLVDPSHRSAQELRLRIQIEKEAFVQMTPAWRRLGFPFPRLVPSYATAIGASADRPVALARLMGIIVDDGMDRPSTGIRSLRIAAGTPYQTEFEPGPAPATRVMSPEVAHALRGVLAEIPQRGTARRLAGVFQAPDGTPIPIAGKTGSGDARFDTFSRGGQRISSRPTGRTAVFVFALGESHFGVITAMVSGAAAGNYSFTSALPVTVLAMLAPALTEHLDLANDGSMVADRAPLHTESGGTPTLAAIADIDSAGAERRAGPPSGAGPGRTQLIRLP